MDLAKIILADFLAYTARYWTLLFILVLFHLICSLWTRLVARPSASPLDTNAAVLDYFFRKGYELEDDVFQGRLGAEYVLSKLGTASCVHIKWWSKPVGSNQVQEIFAAQRKLYCKYAILISKEGFTRAARREAMRTGVWLWDFYCLEDELERFSEGLAEGFRAVAATGN